MNLLQDPSLFHQAALINGQWLSHSPHGSYALINPATGAQLAQLPRCQQQQAEQAVEQAHEAFLLWRQRTAKARSELLYRWYQLVLEHREDVATLITLEEGKPLAEARAEVDYAASFLQWFAEEAKRVRGDVIPSAKQQQRLLVLKQPIGVCAAITPWNFPAAMITRKAGPALAAGCTMVLKPASQTPLTALALADLALRAGIPAGVFNVLTGNDSSALGAVLTTHPLVRKLTFTGSTEVGRGLLAQAASTIKKCSMELGGNAPFIVFDDADLDAAVEGLMACKFRNTGQACVSANRVLVQSGVYRDFAQRLAQRVQALKVSNGLEPGAQQGPLIDKRAVEKVKAHIADALAGGAELLCGGKEHALGGCFFEPTVLIQLKPSMAIAGEETFGPVAPLFEFEDEAEALRLANDTDYGLAAYFYSRDGARIWRVAEALESGMVGINCGLMSNEVGPFGGVKQSGLGREGSHYGIDEFLEIKYLCWDGQ